MFAEDIMQANLKQLKEFAGSDVMKDGATPDVVDPLNKELEQQGVTPEALKDPQPGQQPGSSTQAAPNNAGVLPLVAGNAGQASIRAPFPCV